MQLLESFLSNMRTLLVLFNDAKEEIKEKRLRQNNAKFNYNVELILENHVYPVENCCSRMKQMWRCMYINPIQRKNSI